jgi:glycosyltransferase involved in cell wall biosynthesis
MYERKELRVAIDAQVVPWRNGGVTQALIALLRGLGSLQDGDETYRIVVGSDEEIRFWRSVVGPNQELAFRADFRPEIMKQPRLKSFLDVVKRPLRPLMFLAGSPRPPIAVNEKSHWASVPISDGFYESLNCDVLHFPYQQFAVCSIPTVFNPHDLQHLHYPQFFKPREIVRRESIYSAGCRFAQTVVVGSQWAKDDLVRQYGIDAAKVQVIPEGPPTQLSANPGEDVGRHVKEKYQLPDAFIFYPAITWPHKNHIRLLEALAYLRETRGLEVPLVCTGATHEGSWPRIEQRIQELGIEALIKFLGFVPEEELRAIYQLARGLVLPSLFEASSLPIFEAWFEGIPVACSNVTALPGQVLDAALLFDPNSVESIANAIARLVNEQSLRDELREWGTRRLRDFSWERTAKAYRAVYRRAGGFPLTEEDRWILSWDWMRSPQRRTEVGHKVVRVG